MMYKMSVSVAFEDRVGEEEGDVEDNVEEFHPSNPDIFLVLPRFPLRRINPRQDGDQCG